MRPHNSFEDPLVSASWLIANQQAPDLRIVDATWTMPWGAEKRSGAERFAAEHIPGSVHFDIDTIADTASDLPHMLPSPEVFASMVRKLGLGDGHRIVLYDAGGFIASARAWWMFRAMGHDDVAVLDGGLPAWIAAGGATEDLPLARQERHFTARARADLVKSLAQMQTHVTAADVEVIDARPGPRFAGTAPEPRAGIVSGHMPGAKSLPHGGLIQPDGRMRPAAEIKTAFDAAGADLSRQLVTTCGSGVTAAVLALGLARLGHFDVAVYDGSWAEWASQPNAPVVTE
jgi:thiosulfate/3-mercaptopyruvate sulfurtransferase